MNNAQAQAQDIVSDTILAAPSEEARIEIASDLIRYSLGAIAALGGKEKAAEIAYRFADALVKRR